MIVDSLSLIPHRSASNLRNYVGGGWYQTITVLITHTAGKWTNQPTALGAYQGKETHDSIIKVRHKFVLYWNRNVICMQSTAAALEWSRPSNSLSP